MHCIDELARLNALASDRNPTAIVAHQYDRFVYLADDHESEWCYVSRLSNELAKLPDDADYNHDVWPAIGRALVPTKTYAIRTDADAGEITAPNAAIAAAAWGKPSSDQIADGAYLVATSLDDPSDCFTIGTPR